jgi:hypothetical protein
VHWRTSARVVPSAGSRHGSRHGVRLATDLRRCGPMRSTVQRATSRSSSSAASVVPHSDSPGRARPRARRWRDSSRGGWRSAGSPERR